MSDNREVDCIFKFLSFCLCQTCRCEYVSSFINDFSNNCTSLFTYYLIIHFVSVVPTLVHFRYLAVPNFRRRR